MLTDRADRAICAAALSCSGLTALSLSLPAPAAMRAAAVLLFCCWVPGTALFATLGAWKLVRSPVAAVAASLAIVVLLSQAALAAHLWAPAIGTGLLALACGGLFVVALVRSTRVRRRV